MIQQYGTYSLGELRAAGFSNEEGFVPSGLEVPV